ncbi:hypothetical protein HPB48_016835 [Haemaphysalis longicornis]|uniref:Uncharacterized protein n=1 Tax=Haemaphysalis longicornis TaxID=44386 RepID=A0A9J6GAL9_HAELO|nr:hypothetical protein HPB48_016835 [Haemaphysalis longicornis]
MEIKQRYSAVVTVSELFSACKTVGYSEASQTEVKQPEVRPSAVPTLLDVNVNSDVVPDEATTKTQQKVVAATCPGARLTDDVMSLSDFYEHVRLLNERQASLIRELIHRVTDQMAKLMQIFSLPGVLAVVRLSRCT